MCTQVSIATTAVETKEEQAEEEVQDAHQAEVGRRGRGGPPQVCSVVDAIHHEQKRFNSDQKLVSISIGGDDSL